MLLSHNEIIKLCEEGVIENWKDTAVNAASLDLHLGNKILIEAGNENFSRVVDYKSRERLNMKEVDLTHVGYVLRPGEFILASTKEIFHLPYDISAEYKLKSSMARIGIDHLNAGWADAGWHGSVLTLEFKNVTNYHEIRIRPGDAIGQMIFFRHAPVDYDQSYAARGRYNQDKTVSGIKV